MTRFALLAQLILLPLLLSCSDEGGPIDPGTKGPAELVITPRYTGDAPTGGVSRLRARVEDPASGRILGTLERALAPGEETQALTLSVEVAQPLNVRATLELLGAGDRVEWSGRGSVALQPGMKSAHTLDLYRGPLANLDVTGLTLVAPTVALAEGDTLRLSAKVVGASGTPVLYWSSGDTTIATLTEDGLLRARLPGVVRVRVVAGPKSDTTTISIGARVARLELTPDTLRFGSLGEEASVMVRALDGRGGVITGAALTWSVADPAVAVSLGEGRVRAVGNGQTTLTAQSATDAAIRASATLRVAQGVAAVSVEPGEAVLGALGETATFRANAVDANGNAVADRTVRWSSSNPAVASISAEGVATTVGNGATTLTATVDGVSGSAKLTVRQTVRSIKIAPDALYLSALDETAQLSATAFDAGGNRVADAVFTWSSSAPGVAEVSIDGVVQAVGTGGARITARVGEVSASAAVYVEQSVASLAVTPAAGTLAALGATVQLQGTARDANGYPVEGASLSWSSLEPGTATVSPAGLVTAVANGVARIRVTAGSHADTARITVAQLPAALAAVAGAGQTGTVAALLPISPAVKVTDARGNPVAGVSVSFAASGDGSVTGSPAITNASGVATLASWTLATMAGANTLTATAGALSTSFSATGTAGAAANIAVSAGDNQTAAVGSAVGTAPAVKITDQYGNPVAGVSVSFAASDAGSVTGSPATTDTGGVATAGSWTLSTVVGANTLTATAGALSTSFSATGTAGAPANIAVSAGDNQTAAVGSAVGTAPAVKITDQYGNAVAGVSVSFAASGDGSVTADSAITNVSGVATGGSWTLATAVGANTLTATAGALSISFSATGTAGAAANITVSAGNTQTAAVGSAVATAPAVKVTDLYGNPVLGVSVSFAASGDGSVTGSPATTDAGGVATLGSWTLATTAGANSLTATAGALSISFSATGTAGVAAKLGITTQPASTAQSGVAFSRQPVIHLLDQYGNVSTQAGVSVTAAIASGGGTLGGTLTAGTDSSGVATFTNLTISGTIGDRTLSFSASGLTGATSDTITVTAGTATALAFSVQPANVVASAPIAPAVQVSILDAYGNLVASATDTVTLALGTNPSSGILSGTASVAASGGVATFSGNSIDLTGTGYTLTASSGALTSATSTGFNVTHGPLDHFLVEAAGSGDIGDQLAGTPFNVRLTAQDAYNNTVTSFTGTVGFTSTPTGGISAGATSGAFTAGVLSSHSITFGTAGSFMLTATSGTASGTSGSFGVQAPPTAVNDVPASNSAPGDAYHAFYSTAASPQTFTLTPWALTANDNLGFPEAAITSFGADSLGGSVTTHAAGSTVAPLPGHTTGSLTVNANGSIALTPPDGFTGRYVFRYRLTNARGTSDARVTIAVGERPVAADDAYPHTLVGNVPINTSTSTNFRVTANDKGDAKKLAIVDQNNGTATLNADSTFTFRPTPGYEGPASFTYTVANGFGPSAPATVSMTVANPIWFVNAAADAGGDGSYDSPFNTLPALAAINNGTGTNPAANDRIFLYSGSYTGGLTLLANQRLIGQGATASLSSIAGVTWPVDAKMEPTMSGAAPSITTAIASTNGVNLGFSNTLRGFDLGNATGAALYGNGFGTLTVAEVGINTNGQALNLTQGTLAGSFREMSSSGGTINSSLTNVTMSGEVDFGSGALSGATNTAFYANGGGGSFRYAGSISNSSVRSVSITSRTAGTVTLSGAINPITPGRGISVSYNAGTTINFSGPAQHIGAGMGVFLENNDASTVVSFTGGNLQIASTDVGFKAIGGGTVQVTGSNNTLSTTGEFLTALSVENTTIGAGGLNFRSISADGGDNGIVLINTGSLAGLTVTGDGVTPGSGGTIRNTEGGDLAVAGNGIYLSNTRDVVLNWMQLNDHSNHAIRGSNVTNFTLHRTRIIGVNGTNSAGGYNEGSVSFDNLLGQAAFTNSYIGGGFTDNVRVVTSSGTLDRIVFNNDTIAHNSASDGNDGILLESQGTAVINATITANLFTGARGDLFQFALQEASRGDLVLERNNFHNSHPNTVSGGGGVTVGGGGGATASAALTYRIEDNSFRGALGAALAVSKYGGVGMHSGTIRNNVIGQPENTSLGSSQGSALFVGHTGGGTHTTLIEGNSLDGYASSGISLQVGDASTGGSGAFNATLRDNTIASPGPFASYGVMLNAGTTSVDAHQICLDLGGAGATPNALAGSGPTFDVYLRQRQSTTVRLPGYAGANNDNAAVSTFAANANALSEMPSANAVNNVAGGGGGFVGGASCAQP